MGGDSLCAPDIKRIKERGKLIVAQHSGEMPLFFMLTPKGFDKFPKEMRLELPDGRSVCGFDVAIAKFLAKVLNVEIDLKRSYPTYRDVVDAVARGEADLGISNLCMTFGRLQSVRFSQPYATFSFALLVNRRTMIEKRIELGAKSTGDDFDRFFDRPEALIGVEARTAPQEQLPLIFPKAKAVPFKTQNELLLALRDQKIDAVIGDDFYILYVMSMDPELHLHYEMLRIPDTPYKIAVAVNPEFPTLKNIVDEISTYIKIEPPVELIRKYEGVLRALAEPKESPAAAGGLSAGVSASAAREASEGVAAGMRLRLSTNAYIAVGLPLAVFVIVWLRMARRKRRTGS